LPPLTMESPSLTGMFIDFSPRLPEDDAELLELELCSIADELRIPGIDLYLAAEDGAEIFEMLTLDYKDERKDDERLRRHGVAILEDFERRQSAGKPLTMAFTPVLARVGRIQLKLARG
jgi:hypothetical protein